MAEASDVVVVTGASAGIGEAISARLLDDGYTVVTLQRSAPASAHKRLHFRSVDLADLEATCIAARTVAAEFDVGHFVHNAGANRPALLDDATIDDMRYVNDITLGAALVLAQAFVPGMRRSRYGRIVHVSSRAVLGKRGRAVYSAAKAGLIGMTRTMAIETGGDGITVNAVLPGPVATAHFDRGHPLGSVQRETVVGNVLVGRVGMPADVSHAVAFLLHRQSGFITGQSLYVCGGTSVTGTGGQ